MGELVQITKRFTSRSAVLSEKTCGYKRYLTYHYNGYGITGANEPLALLIGTIVHRGMQHLLEHCRKHESDEQLTTDCINEAVEVARELWLKTLSKKNLLLHSGEYDRLPWIIAEQECLWEGLIRAWAIKRLPDILEEFIILEVEKEEVFENFSDMVTFLGKADGLFLGKPNHPSAAGKIVQLSIKTASTFPEVTQRNIQHDMQGVSEQVCTNDRLEKAWKKWEEIVQDADFLGLVPEDFSPETQAFIKQYSWFKEFKECPTVYAVQYEFLLKGQRKQDPQNSGIYKQQSFLCHPYKLDSIMTLSGNSLGFTPTSYKWKTGSGRQAKGWEKTDIWDDIGIENWVEMLAMGKVQPEEGDPFQNILIFPGLVIRLPEEIEEWKVSTSYGEEVIAKHLDEIDDLVNVLNNTDIPDKAEYISQQIRDKIWQYFPKNTQNCHDFYGEDCQFVNHCHELADLTTLEESGLVQPRVPHHDLEKEMFIKKGFINDE